ncbi:MAG: hypothetical protein O9327_11000 [Polaromonas sp.]|nr:hypothetical protein [Polaromonas sp.]
MQIKPLTVAIATSLGLTIALAGHVPGLVLSLTGWGEEGVASLLLLVVVSLAVAAWALHRRLHEAAKLKASPSHQGQVWLQRHLLDCTATLESIGHESATPHLVAGPLDSHP